MRKKFLAYLLAAGMVLAAAPVIPAGMDAIAVAAEVDIEKELECTTFWSAHTKGVEVGTEGVALKFNSKTNDAATNNWETPVLVVYSSEDGLVHEAGAAGYTEYAVIRSDAYAWNGQLNTGDVAAWEAAGYKMVATMPSDWAAWVAKNKSGVECTVQAIKSGDKVYVQFINGDSITVTTIPVASDAKVLISLTGENCKLTDITGADYTGIDGVSTPSDVTPTPAPSDGTPEPTAAPEEPTNTPAPPSDDNTSTDDDNTSDDEETPATKKKMTVKVVAKKDATKVTGTVSVAGAKVQVKVDSKAFKKATVNGKKFTFKTTKLAKGAKVTVKVTKSGYKTVTKKVTVK